MKKSSVGGRAFLAGFLGWGLLVVTGGQPARASEEQPEILFNNYVGDFDRIFVMDADGSNQTLVFPFDGISAQWKGSGASPSDWSPYGRMSAVDWSPDGTKFILAKAVKGEVWVIDVAEENGKPAGTNPQLFFTDSPGANPLPRWSRSGASIAIGRFGEGENQVWVIPVSPRSGCSDPFGNGPALTLADLERGCGDLVPTMSLDQEGNEGGRWSTLGAWGLNDEFVAVDDYWADPDDNDYANHNPATCGGWSAIRVIDLKSGSIREVARFPHSEWIGAGVSDWARTPGGTDLLVGWRLTVEGADQFPGPYEIFTLDPSIGSSPIGRTEGRDPSWAPDGRQIVYGSIWPDGGIWKLDVATGQSVQLAATGRAPRWLKPPSESETETDCSATGGACGHVVLPAAVEPAAASLADTFVGAAVANPNQSPVSLSLSALTSGGEAKPAGARGDVPASGQDAFLSREVVEAGSGAAALKIDSPDGPVQGFFMIGNNDLRRLDGVGGVLRPARNLVLPIARQSGGGETLVCLFNVTAEAAADLTLRLFDPLGAQLGEVGRSIARSGFLEVELSGPKPPRQ